LEYSITKFLLKKESTIWDGSAIITGLILAFNVPSNLPHWIIFIGALVAIGIGKLSFGGLGNNPFNPALVGRVFMIISFPMQMTKWPVAMQDRLRVIDVETGATPLALIKEGIKNGESVTDIMQQLPSYFEMFMGKMGGSLGEVSAFFLILGGIYLLIRKVITWHTPVSVLGSIFLFTGILWLINPVNNADPIFHLISGGAILGGIYMASDYATSPMTPKGMLVYGTGIGIITVVIRVYGSYPEGISFAILIMNAFVPLLNKFSRPKRFGEGVKYDKK
jgi:electron transport complex protein RnfD